MKIIFWISLFIILYTYAGYPFLLWGFSLLSRGKKRHQGPEFEFPEAAVLVSAYNEDKSIEQKINNTISSVYPRERLKVYLCSDGSTDKTAEIIQKSRQDNVVPKIFDQNIGKINVLNLVIPDVQSEILFLTDATAMVQKDAFELLVQHFESETVGCVSASYRVVDEESSSLGEEESFYWKYESWIKTMESNLGIALGAHGSLYAIRKDLYPFPEKGTINEDYVVTALIASKGYRIEYEPKAIAYEKASEMDGFARRIRIATGNYQQLNMIKYFLGGKTLPFLWHLISHKFLRLIVPELLIVLLIISIILSRDLFFAVFGSIQVLFYGIALIKWISIKKKFKIYLTGIPYYFCMINFATLLGLFNIIIGKGKVKWGKG